MTRKSIAEEHVPLLRRALAASADPDLRDIGRYGEIDYLVEDSISQTDVSILENLIATCQATERECAVERLQKQRDAIQPYVGNRLLRAAMWHAARSYEIRVDAIREIVVYSTHLESPNPSGTENDRMPIRWPHTVLQDRESEPYQWIAAKLFPADLKPTSFDASTVLYRTPLDWDLLEFVVFGRPQPARFSQSQLNAAIMDACRAGGFEPAAYWWYAHDYDGCRLVVESVGTYSFRDPLEPLFIQLGSTRSKEGGPAYAGLLDREYRWALSLSKNTGFSIAVHGSADFCRSVAATLEFE